MEACSIIRPEHSPQVPINIPGPVSDIQLTTFLNLETNGWALKQTAA